MTPPQGLGKKKILLPGYGRSLNYKPKKGDRGYVGDLFANALSEENICAGLVGLSTLTVREIRMLAFMNRITDKPEWFVKVNEDKWKNEVLRSDLQFNQRDFTSKMTDCMAELRHMASLHSVSPEKRPPVFVFNGDVVKSDTAVSIELKNALQSAISRFEAAIPEKLKNWRPGSNEKVLDLVDPSLCPLVYGRTRILCDGETTTLDDCIERCGNGQISNIPLGEQAFEQFKSGDQSTGDLKVFSTKFQWLPCEVDVASEPARIMSYINDLHPKTERKLYDLIERIIDATIPLWNATLAPLAEKDFRHQRRIDYPKVEYNLDPEDFRDQEPFEDEDGYDDYVENRNEWILDNRELVHPEPEGNFQPRRVPSFDLRSKYGKRGLQVIVKLSNVELTPEKPDYEGEAWQVEGRLNEHIVATALYYYSCENITNSSVGFRQICRTEDVDLDHEQEETRWLDEIFGCQNWSGAIQDVGSVEIREGRLITFPNVLQHHVAPFKLADPTKPGHRKVVALFLVDPNIKITSTAHVPCQQQAWWWETVMASPTKLSNFPDLKKAIGKIPIEIQDFMLDGVDFPFSATEAQALKLELMEEQKSFVVKHAEVFEDTISFSL